MHHLYWGWWLEANAGYRLFVWAGHIAVWDDIIQHWGQVWNPDYHSPLYNFYADVIYPHLPDWLREYADQF